MQRKTSTQDEESTQAGREDEIKEVKSFVRQWRTWWEGKEFEKYVTNESSYVLEYMADSN